MTRGATGSAPKTSPDAHPKIGKLGCPVQDSILAYLLRVNPAVARQRILQAIAARGDEFSACNHGLFHSIWEIRYDSLLEEIGIQSLDDPDPQAAMTAATMLGNKLQRLSQLNKGSALPTNTRRLSEDLGRRAIYDLRES